MVLPMLTRDISRLPVIGLDCEWVSQEDKAGPVAMLQLATYSGLCVLVRLCNMATIPNTLKEVLARQDIYKVGVAVLDDSTKLISDFGLDVVSCVDLRHLVVRFCTHQGKLGLEALANLVLGVQLDKDWRLRAGDWEAESLTQRQVDYAANDALVGVNIAWVILSNNFTRTVGSWVRALMWDQEQLVGEVTKVLDEFADLKFNNRGWKTVLKAGKEKSNSPSPLNDRVRFNAIRKSPLYHNCMLQAPDGQVLCTCDIKKAKWYVAKEIGDLVCEEPYTVRLRFEPSGRPEGKAGEYYLSVKPNICVVCGSDDSFLRKNVVPHEYRRYFPAVMKDHQSHDVLLMCVRCHQRSNYFDADLRKRLSEECSAPIGTETDVKLRENWELKKVRSAGRALQANRRKQCIPQNRLEELHETLLDHYQVEEITEEIVDRAASANFLEENGDYVPHSRAVVQHFLERGGLLQLEVTWRKHFLRTMEPAFLPDLWSIDHQADRLGVKAAENRIDMDQYKLATEGVDIPELGEEQFDLEAYRNTRQAQLGINPCRSREQSEGVESFVGGSEEREVEREIMVS
eukprot:GFUD01050253.1.p1 GENE.GFUD01050253.1~~GFUD01050253.1.p1  ORF type:complete len:571 (+),score=175.73 GFUD01050253.1:246-1958(+)